MAEDTQPAPAASEVIVVVGSTVTDTKPEEQQVEPKKPTEDQPPAPEPEPTAAAAEAVGVTLSASFNEESNVVADLEDPEKKALDELKQLIHAALANKEFTLPPPPPPPAADVAPAKEDEVKTEDAKTEEVKTETEAPQTTLEVAEQPPEAQEPALSSPAAADTIEEKAVVIKAEANAEEAVEEAVVPVAADEPPEEIFIWGVPLVGDEKSDTVLLKFLCARDFKVKDAMTMLKNAVIWRKQFGIDSLIEEDLEIPELEKTVFYHGFDKEGHPVCYNVYGEFQNKELYAKAFGDEEKRDKFLRWRIQYLEKGIREKLEFSPGGVCSMVQVNDLKNTISPGKKELRVATNKALTLLQDNYPEFVAKQVFINVPWWYIAYNRLISSIFTQRSKSKFVFAGPAKSTETLFKYIEPNQVPVQYGGLSKDNDPDFTTGDAVTEVTIKPASKQTIEIPATEGSNLIWELRVLGWEVSYGAEFAPNAEDAYTVIVQKLRKFIFTDEPYIKNSFKIGEPGKVVLTINNATSKKKKLLYRYKGKSSTEST